MAFILDADDLSSMDDLTAEMIIHLQIEDAGLLKAGSKGKGREGELTDAELALQIYTEELQRSAVLISDRRMTKSISLAVENDETALAEYTSRELLEATDRGVACTLDGQAVPNAPARIDQPSDLDDENLAKLAATYNAHPVEVDESETGEGSVRGSIAGSVSSHWRSLQNENRLCVVCSEYNKLWQTARAPCGHEYCQDCLQGLFNSSMTDESLFPPRCCRQLIPPSQVRIHLTTEIIKKYDEKKTEFESPNRTYCSRPTCSNFLRPETIDGDVGTCSDCGTATCVTCKNGAHEEDCPADTNLQLLLDTARENYWQRCYSCRSMVSLATGCYHIKCRCGAEFCYDCGMAWKTCLCDQWDEAMLFDRGEEIVARQPLGVPRIQVAEVVQNLRERHNCDHGNWTYIRGSHACEHCYQTLPLFIFECGQCHLRACNRCRNNRL